MNSLLVSIIIPTLNRANLIGETLDSIIAQTYTNWECIVVDDGSSDHTASVMEYYTSKEKRIKYYQRPSDRKPGGNAARNYGFELSKGDLINWFDSDDLMKPNKLEVQVRELEQATHNFCVSQSMVFDHNTGEEIGLRSKIIYSNDFFNDFILHDIKWLTQSPLIKRSFLIHHNLGFDEGLYQCQERDFFIKVLAEVESYSYVKEPLVLIRSHDNNISNSERTEKKLNSIFEVEFRALNNYTYRLNNSTSVFLKKVLKNYLRESVYLKFDQSTKSFLKKIARSKSFTFYELLKLRFAVFILNNFRIGYSLFK